MGSDSVWAFDFGNKMLVCNSYKMNLKEEDTLLITENENQLLNNVLSMTLYAFGKWGKIKGLTVDKDYSDLNQLFGSFLSEIQVEPVLTVDSLRFYKNDVQITYEDIIQNVLDKKLQDETEIENKDNENDDATMENNSKYNKGLWHKIIWKSEHDSFLKERIDKSDKLKTRMGNNFYMSTYKCPDCGEKLFMVVYPEGKEYLIETDQKGVYVARIYTCHICYRMYTPKPQKFLFDGDVFCIDFEDDLVAYSDYLEVIGQQGERTSNSNFNQYEVNYNRKNIKKEDKKEDKLDEIFNEMNSLTDHEIFELQDKMDSGFYPKKSIDTFQKVVDTEVKNRQKKAHNKEIKGDTVQDEAQDEAQDEKSKQDDGSITKTKSTIETGAITKTEGILKPEIISKNEVTLKTEGVSRPEVTLKTEVTHKTEATSGTEATMQDVIITADKIELGNGNRVANHQSIDTSSKNFISKAGVEHFSDQKDNIILKSDLSSHDKEKELVLKAVQCKDKNYTNILRFMKEIKKEDINQSSKDSILNSLQELLKKRGIAELDAICSKIPDNITKAQHIKFTQIIEQYVEIDNNTHKKHLDLKRDEAEKREIAAYINLAKPKERKSLSILYHKLKKEDFEERNVVPFLENINEKIRVFDEAIISKICPEPAELTFEDGLKAYEEISAKDLLPELKVNILSEIDNRLRKIKMNECEQLVEKLAKDIGNQAQKCSRIHFYDVRKGMHNNDLDEETQVMKNAQNTYTAGKGKYEFPILVCDTSAKENGIKGFILTPDHIFYNRVVDFGVIDINNIEDIKASKGILGTRLCANTLNEGKVKISNSLGLSNLKNFAEVLNDFLAYLKEKPESRELSYLAEEKHKVKCCYRCGFIYRDGITCPKCGAKINE